MQFTPISAAIGGTLIGFSAVLFMWLNGRIAGISGIFHGLISPRRGEFFWRLAFILGLSSGGLIYYFLPVIHFNGRTHYPVWLLISAGALVSLGTRLGGGCTSGHGVCGIARLSIRSFVATMIFLAAGMVTVYLMHHIGQF